MVNKAPADAGGIRDPVLVPGSGRPLEKGMATHSSILALRIPRTEELGRLWSTGLHRVGRDWVTEQQQQLSQSRALDHVLK